MSTSTPSSFMGLPSKSEHSFSSTVAICFGVAPSNSNAIFIPQFPSCRGFFCCRFFLLWLGFSFYLNSLVSLGF